MADTPRDPKGADDWGVPAETFPDHMVLRPPNRLIERATKPAGVRDRSDADAIARAEHALEMLSVEFDTWLEDELETLERRRVALSEARDAATSDALYRSAHDLRGQAATFGYPLAGEIADGLCTLIEEDDGLPPQPHVDMHVEAIRAIVRENARSRDHLIGSELVARLAQLRFDYAETKRRD